MKARIPRESELVLLYRLEGGEPNGDKVREILKKLDIPFRDILQEMVGWPLGACAGLPGCPPGPESGEWEIPECEAMIMAGFTNLRMDKLLEALRGAGARIRFKAVITPHNRNWPFAKLLGELGREERLMAVFVPMRKRLERARSLAPTLPKDAKILLEAAIRRAADLAEGNTEPTEDRLRAADEALRLAMGEEI